MKKGYVILLILFFYSYITVYGQDSADRKGINAINGNVIRAQLGFLSSDWMEGRRSGEKGELMSSDYIASMLMLYGVKPWGDMNRTAMPGDQPFDNRSYFQDFILVKKTPAPGQSLELSATTGGFIKNDVYTYDVDFYVRPAETGEKEAPVVFVGYGFINKKTGFNNIEDADLRNKFVLSLRGIPAYAESKLTRSEINASVREFENFVRSKGAAGLISINPGPGMSMPAKDMSPAERTPRPYQVYSDYSLEEKEFTGNIPAVQVTMKTANDILSGTGNSIEEYRKNADENRPYAFKPLDGKKLKLKTVVSKEHVAVRNILGIIEGNNKDEYIVIGAHYDHMGMNNGYIWNGADDNGSGTVGVMTLAKAIMETGKKPEKNIIIALWTAEEQGLLGSEYFVKNLNIPARKIRLNVNFDMISRYITEDQKNKVVMTYTSSEKSFRELTASNLKKYGIDLNVEYQPSDDPPGGSDHRSFVAAGIPIMRFKPGHREEYHTPDDEISTIDWDIMEKIIKISFANIWQLADSEW